MYVPFPNNGVDDLTFRTFVYYIAIYRKTRFPVIIIFFQSNPYSFPSNRKADIHSYNNQYDNVIDCHI